MSKGQVSSNYPELLEKGGFTNDESTDVIISLPPPPVGQSEKEFKNWVSIDDDDQTVQIPTEKKFEKLVVVMQNNDELVTELSDNDEPEKATPTAAKIQKCLCRFMLRLDRTGFQKISMFSAMKAEADDHLRKTFPSRKISLHSFLCIE